MTLEERAFLVAEKAHANQSYGILSYMYHIKMVHAISVELGFDEEIRVGSILHDTGEDTPLSYNDIKTNFTKPIAEIVFCVTDELGRNRKERKAKTYPKIRANWKATAVKLCDRIANMRNSKEFKPNLFKMYIEEAEDFRNALFSEDHPDDLMKAWDLIDEILLDYKKA